ncbi:flagellar hook-length control protein FliK [Rhizobium sp. LjRoot30]|uniref:flagellar hook-length control protein FliK n=1 Tax=Rhizobium sp. LjRoot30 TaxID=3342320 RepID=UPI003ECDFF8E
MMDQGIGSALPGLNAAASAKPAAKHGQQGQVEKDGGFGEALDQVGHGDHRNGQKAAADGKSQKASDDLLDATLKQGAETVETTETPTGAVDANRIKKPIIDIQQGASQRQAQQHLFQAGSVLSEAKAATAKSKDAIEKLPRHLDEEEAQSSSAAVVKGEGTHARKTVAAALAGLNAKADETQVDPAATPSAMSSDDVMSLLGAEALREIPQTAPDKAQATSEKHVDDVGRARTAPHDISDKEAASGLGGEDIAATASDGGDAKTFRFARADGKGQTMDMVVGGRERSGAADEPRRTTSAETVTVLDSRRYLGLAQNSSAVLDAISGDSEWSKAMQPSSALSNAATQASTGKVVNTLKLQLQPISLGMVTATMRLVGDELSVDLTVESASAYRQLSSDHKSIIEALRSQGFSIDQVTVTLAPTTSADSSNSSTQNGSQNGSFGQQGAQDGSGGAASRRDERNAAQQQWSNARQSGEDGLSDSGAGSAGARSGSLYL